MDPVRELDTRVFQANERTLLAWLRTGIGLMTFGFVVAKAAHWTAVKTALDEPGAVRALPWLGAALVALGALFSALACIEYTRVRRAMIDGRPLRVGRILPVALAILVAAAGAVIAGFLVAGA